MIHAVNKESIQKAVGAYAPGRKRIHEIKSCLCTIHTSEPRKSMDATLQWCLAFIINCSYKFSGSATNSMKVPAVNRSTKRVYEDRSHLEGLREPPIAGSLQLEGLSKDCVFGKPPGMLGVLSQILHIAFTWLVPTTKSVATTSASSWEMLAVRYCNMIESRACM